MLLPSRRSFGSLIAILIALAAVPTVASAAEYTVNVRSVGPGCEAQCTLPGAIEAANANPGKDVIKFDPTVFQGAAPFATITLATALPAITESVEVLGGRCNTGWSLEGPCVELTLNATGATSILTVSANQVTVAGIAFDGAGIGILAAKNATGLTAANDWFGTGLNRGGGSANAVAGIRLEPGANLAKIGGPAPTERNVFTAGALGLYVDGASSTVIRGNSFGLRPDGEYSASTSLENGIRIVDAATPLAKAVNTEVGGVIAEPEATTDKCDGACNVIVVNGGDGIDLAGSSSEGAAAATGPTAIRGNYIGLGATGPVAPGSAADGIRAATAGAPGPGPGSVTIGGSGGASERNLIVGGEYGIFAERAEDLAVEGNWIGWNAKHEAAATPSETDVLVSSEGVTGRALVAGNDINANGTVGIESKFTGAEVKSNEILGGATGIVAGEEDEGVGNYIAFNHLIEQHRVGIEILESANRVVGNTISRANWSGIAVDHGADHNRIGGDGPGEANTITESGLRKLPEDGAITVNTRTGRRNEIAANTGSGNNGAFIKLFIPPMEMSIANGIVPPILGTVLQSSASGTTAPNATVRLFTKTSAEPGELGAYLGKVAADASGAWKATFAQQPVGTLVAATATVAAGTPEGGTSEVSAPSSAAAEPVIPNGGGTVPPAVTPAPAAPAPVPVAPKAKIKTGPTKLDAGKPAKFTFTASVAGSTFQCKLDKAKFKKCRSPQKYTGLKVGKHTFQVRAVGRTGLIGKPVKRTFTVVE